MTDRGSGEEGANWDVWETLAEVGAGTWSTRAPFTPWLTDCVLHLVLLWMGCGRGPQAERAQRGLQPLRFPHDQVNPGGQHI